MVVILSSPYDINLIKGSKGDKRHFLDLEISLLDKSYLKASTAYKKILRERNDLLKTTNIDLVLLDVLTKQLISFLEIIYKKRIDFIDKINQRLTFYIFSTKSKGKKNFLTVEHAGISSYPWSSAHRRHGVGIR